MPFERSAGVRLHRTGTRRHRNVLGASLACNEQANSPQGTVVRLSAEYAERDARLNVTCWPGSARPARGLDDQNLRLSDAFYVELADQLDVPLITTDLRLARATPRAEAI